jgi:sugar phosphate isomerase/epimerase
MKLAYPIATPEVRSPILGIEGDPDETLPALRDAGYDGIEPFVANPAKFPIEAWARAVERAGLEFAAVGTGPVVSDDKLTFTDRDESVRRAAIARAKDVVRFAARLGAQVNIGKLRGELPPGSEAEARGWMRAAFSELCEFSATQDVNITLEPQNRTVINNLNTTGDALAWLRDLALPNLRLMLDVFHMDYEGEAVARGFAEARDVLYHVHYADTERRVPGDGRLPFATFTDALRAIGYDRFITVEIKQEPNALTAARRSAAYLRPLLSPS